MFIFALLGFLGTYFWVYVEASFTSNCSTSLGMRYATLLCDLANHFYVLFHCSRKPRWVAKSAVEVELCSFIDKSNAAMTISTALTHAFGMKVSIKTFPNSKQVFRVITPEKSSTKKRHFINISTTWNTYQWLKFYRVGMVCGDLTPSDHISKVKSQ